jgi:EAL domain-containing protein (putative c-di-GMP-specific phosphodiesterase class I)
MTSQDLEQPPTGRELRAALVAGTLAVHYQPIRAADDLELVAYESLARWPHPSRGMVPPLQFIAIAEQNGLIHELGLWVLRRACRDLPALGARYVGVNVSGVQLRHAGFAANFARVVAEQGIEPVQVTVEITESVALRDDGPERRNLYALRDMGCYVAVDDFGTGYAGLDYLDRFPFNVLKIDKSFVAGLGGLPVAEAAVASLCELGVSRGMVTVAEGVETEMQLGLLRRLGCSRVQGYLLGKPAAADAWTAAAVAPRAADSHGMGPQNLSLALTI